MFDIKHTVVVDTGFNNGPWSLHPVFVAKSLPSQTELKRIFSYDPDTGDLAWRIKVGRDAKVGVPFSRPAVNGYLRVQWHGKTLKAHRVIWKLVTGRDPVGEIDHINRDQTDNRWENLREATRTEQNRNRYIRRNTAVEFAANVLKAAQRAKAADKSTASICLPDQAQLLVLFSYDPVTGDLFRTKTGRVVRTMVRGTHFKTSIGAQEVYAHRVIWKMMTGTDPVIVDHINGNGLDNRWVNLRNGSSRQNLGNTKIFRNNKSGIKGVYWAKDKNKWTAQISIGNKIRYLGRYDRIEDAKAAYEIAARVHFELYVDAIAKQ